MATAGFAVAVVLCGLLSSGAAAAGQPIFYELPTAVHATSMTAGPDAAIWFTGRRGAIGGQESRAVVGSVGESGQVQVFDLPKGRYARPIAAGPDGGLWFGMTYLNRRGYTVARIGRMSTEGGYSEFPIGEHVGGVGGVVAGPEGGLWFTLVYAAERRRGRAAIGRIDGSGAVQLFALPPRSAPGGIALGADGNLWFTERGHELGRVGSITPAGQVSQFRLPDETRLPTSIVAGPDGNLWFGEQQRNYSRKNRVGRITTAGAISEFRVAGRGWTRVLAAGPEGAAWFTTGLREGPQGVGSIAPSGAAAAPACLRATPCEIDADTLAVGPDGALWFAASKYYSHMGGGGTGLYEGLLEEQEAGLVGRFAP